MFNKLKLRLTLANVIVVVLIFIIVFTGVYITMYKSIISQPSQLLNLLSYNIASGVESQNPKFLKILGNQAFVIVDLSNSGEITKFSGTQVTPVLTQEYVKGLVDKAMTQSDKGNNLFKVLQTTGLSENKPTSIMMRISTLQSSTGDSYLAEVLQKSDSTTSMIFVNIDYENNLLKSLRFNLIMVALAGLVLVFGGSLFMAGKAVKPIKKAWEKQKNFVADASHELRTPLSVIQTNLEIVMENKEDSVESQIKWLDNIYFENKHMTKLVSDLLLLARVDSDQKLLEMKDFSLSTSVEEASAPFVPVAKEKNIEMNFSIERDVSFFGDESRIMQLVVILVDNAVKYTPFGGRIGLELKSSKDSLEIIVTDTGEGISKEHIKKIFERFYRVDKARSSENGGTGLGLSIASWIVKEHHGVISVNSIPGKGSTFKVTLPKKIKQK